MTILACLAQRRMLLKRLNVAELSYLKKIIPVVILCAIMHTEEQQFHLVSWMSAL